MSRFMMLSLLLASLAGQPLHAEIIDRIAAIVDTQVVTLSQVNQVVEIRLIARRGDETDEAYRRRVLDLIIAHILRYRDVERFGAQDVSRDAIESLYRQIIERFPSQEEFERTLARVEMTPEDLQALIRRQLQVQAYIEERFAPLIFVPIEEIEAYYREVFAPQRRERGLTVPSLAEATEEIRSLVRAGRLETEIQRWTEQLRARANVDVFVYR